MKPLATRDPFRIGVVAIAVGLVLCLGVVALSLVTFGTRSYTAVLAQTAGLRKGEDVSVHGVPSGKVRGIELDGSRVRVTFALDKDIHLGAASTAEVKVATLLGTHYLEIDPKADGSLHHDTIPLAQTSVPFNLQDVIEQGTTSLDKLDPEKIAEALTAMSSTFTASTDQIGPALTGVARLSEAVSQRNGQTARLVAAARGVTDQLSASSADLVVLMKQSTLVLQEITRRRAAIHTLLVQTTALSRNLAAITTDTRADLGPAFTKLNSVLQTLRDEDAVLKRLLRTTAPALRYVTNATGNGPWAQLWLKDPGLPPDDVCQRLGGAGCS